MSRERDGAFCSRKGLPRLPRERNGAFCSRNGLPSRSRERNGVFCSRESLPRMSRERDGAFCSRKSLPRMSRERDGGFCSREGLPRLSRERKAAFCSRSGLPRLSRERDGAFCSRKGLPRLSRERNSVFCSRRVFRCAFGRRRVCVVTEESRHPYVILPCTPERQKGAEVSPKRAAWHSRATKSAKSVAPECSAAPLGDGKSNKIITTKKSDCQFADSPTFFVYLSFETVPWGGARLGEGS